MANRHPKIFISYRRDDSAGHAGRLYADLTCRFGIKQVFFDVAAISPGENFDTVIQQAISECDVLIAVIGKRWLKTIVRPSELESRVDFVRLEISTAINRNIPIIPVLIQGEKMPDSEELPRGLEAIARRQALEISDNRWNHDIEQLTTCLKDVIPKQDLSGRTIGVIAGFITLLMVGLLGLTFLGNLTDPIHRKVEAVQIISSVKEIHISEPDEKYLTRLTIGRGISGNKISSYVFNYILMEKVCGKFVERINTSVNVGENVKVQGIFDRGLTGTQQDFLNGPITSKARRLVAEAKAERLLSKDEELSTLIEDENLDTLIANIINVK